VTPAMTFGFMQLLGLDIQQMSIASLIMAFETSAVGTSSL
jgi:hypothetical protein